MSAIRRSQSLLKPLRWVLAGPFLGLLLSKRLLDVAKGLLLTAMPPRFYRQLPEVPIGILVGATLLSVVLARCACATSRAVLDSVSSACLFCKFSIP